MKESAWAFLGKISFARFFNIEFEDVEKMEKYPNPTFQEMLSTMEYALKNIDQNYFGQNEYRGEKAMKSKRTELIDLSDEL